MTDKALSGDRHATMVVGLGLLVQVVASISLIAVAIRFDSYAVAGVARFASVGIPIWLGLLLVFRQRSRVIAEQFESSELRRARETGGDSALFDVDNEDLLVERRKLEWLAKWLLPAVTVVLSLMMIIGSFMSGSAREPGSTAPIMSWGWGYSTVFQDADLLRTAEPQLVMWFVGGVGLICFWFARYAIGLARLREYRLIRAGAAICTGCALACLGVVAALGLGSAVSLAEPVVLYVTRALVLLLGLEFLINFVADFYRPRVAGTIARPSFDSRLLGLVSEPGGIAKSIADAINYQFGFEVSKTWFYQLLKSAFLPLTVLTLAVIIGLSSVLMVDADEQAVVERWGVRRTVDNRLQILGPGLHLKWPWPIEIARRAPVKRLSELLIGEGSEGNEIHVHGHDPDALDPDKHDVILWTEVHAFQAELALIVATSDTADLSIPGGESSEENGVPQADRSVAVSLAMASIPIEYRINDLEAYLYNYVNPVDLLRAVADRVLTDNAAGIDLETLMGAGREAFNRRLQTDIQAEVDRLELGIRLVNCGMQSVHPPSQADVAKTYQEVVSAESRMLATIRAAEGTAEATLTAVAGSATRARLLDQAILAHEALKGDPSASPETVKAARQRVEDLLMGNPSKGIKPLSGIASALIAKAREIRARRESIAASKVQGFASEVAAYNAAPVLYWVRKQLEALHDLGDARKYLIVGDASKVIIEYTNVEPTQIDLSDPGGG